MMINRRGHDAIHGGGIMHDKLDRFAQKAGEEFVAAGRAETLDERELRRATAHDLQQMVSRLRKRDR